MKKQKQPIHGICIPLASLHSSTSYGIGGFFDLLPLLDWCKEVGFTILQLLPLNDSGPDPSPYNALSSCALNPIYLSLEKLPQIDVYALPPPPPFSPYIDYLSVQSFKLNFLRGYLKKMAPLLLSDPEVCEFIDKNSWLENYAFFKVLKDHLAHNPWSSWPLDITPNNLTLKKQYAREIDFYILVQYLCHKQLLFVKEYAQKQDIWLKGDIPILISKDSVDAWEKPYLFDFNFAAGAPPDYYNPEGQYWGFPLFNWEELKKEQFSWWKRRLQAASSYYSFYRLDHVVGFFRMWAIPLNKKASEGFFLPTNPALWTEQGEAILSALLSFSLMTPVAEDLGQIPPSVRLSLQKLGIYSTKVMRWERNYAETGHFIPLEGYPFLSMTTLSTHDSETLQLWWQEQKEDAELYAKQKGWIYSPDLSKEHRLSFLYDAHHTASHLHINLLQEYLALFPEFVWPTPMQERINIPGTVRPENWAYRLRPSVEEIKRHSPLKKILTEQILI